jgi:hypothetical protein
MPDCREASVISPRGRALAPLDLIDEQEEQQGDRETWQPGNLP